MSSPTPTDHDALTIVQHILYRDVHSVHRFTTGLAHYVYDVLTEDGHQLVVRISGPDGTAALAGGLYWSSLLRPKGIPLPEVLYADLGAAHGRFPFVILERLPGTDLGHVYPRLSWVEKQALARDIVRIQAITATLPEGSGFGYVFNREGVFPHRTWAGVVDASLARSRGRIKRAGLVAVQHVDRVEKQLRRFAAYFSAVRPRAFLDDTTTKNVIIDGGGLSGIVDVDVVCYGDPLLTVALTTMALLSSGHDLEYIDAWCALLNLTQVQRHVLQWYTALFCVDFMSELGHAHNKARSDPADAQKAGALVAILDTILAEE